MIRAMGEIGIGTLAGEVSASVHGRADRVSSSGTARGARGASPRCVRLADALAGSGRRVLLYNFPYSERGQRRPDAPAVLEATREPSPSTRDVPRGGAADVWEADPWAVGSPPRWWRRDCARRRSRLPRLSPPPAGQARPAARPPPAAIAAPMLFVQGTRDDFARPDLLEAVLPGSANGRFSTASRRRPLVRGPQGPRAARPKT